MSLESCAGATRAQTIYLAAFVLDALASPREVLRNRTEIEVVKDWVRASNRRPLDYTDATVRAGLIQAHESLAAARFGDVKFAGRWTVDQRVQVVLGNLGVGYMVVESDQAWDEAFENQISSRVQEAIMAFCSAIEDLSPVSPESARPSLLLPGATLLWWHRVSLSRGGSPQMQAVVDDGFTHVALPPDSPELTSGPGQVSGIVRGLLIATEDWLMADATNRLLTEHLAEMDNALHDGDWRAISGFMERGGRLVRESQYLKLYMDERNRYLATSRRTIWRMAREAWGLDAEVDEIDARASAVHVQLQEAAQIVQQRRDRSRNLILFAIGLFTAVQSLLVIYDFAVDDDTSVTAVERLVGGVTALLAGALLFLGLAVWRRRL